MKVTVVHLQPTSALIQDYLLENMARFPMVRLFVPPPPGRRLMEPGDPYAEKWEHSHG